MSLTPGGSHFGKQTSVKLRVQLCALVVGITSAVFSSPSMAQMFARLLPPYEILTIVRSVGLLPTTPPMRAGATYFLRALDRHGRVMRVVVDGRFGEVLSVEPAYLGPGVRFGYYPRVGAPP